MLQFLRVLRRRPEPEPLCRPATIYPNRSGAYGPQITGQGPRNTGPTWPREQREPREPKQ